MHCQAKKILRAYARRMKLARLMEASALCAGSAAMASAIVEAGWAFVLVQPSLAVCICMMSLPVAISLFFPWPRRLLHIETGLARLMTCVLSVAAVAATTVIAAGWAGNWPSWLWPAVLVPAGILAGATFAICRGVTLAQAGMCVDLKCHLNESLSTAAELIAQGRDDNDAMSACVYRQAVEFASAVDTRQVKMWRRTRATAGGVVLSMLLAGTLLFVPPLLPADVQADLALAARTAGSLAEMTPQQRQQLANVLQAAAGRAAESADVRQALARASSAAAGGDAATLKAALELLARGKIRLQETIGSPRVATGDLAGQGMHNAEPSGPPSSLAAKKAGDSQASSSNPQDGRESAATSKPSSGELVRVYNPQYRQGELPAASEVGHSAPAAEVIPSDWNDAWKQAQLRANDAIRSQEIPPEYRQLVRDYFSH